MENQIVVENNETFLKKNWISVILTAMLCVLGMKNNVFLICAYVLLVLSIMFSSMEHKFCWSLFLVPSIRIFDNLGTGILVNILLVLPLLFYFMKKLILREFNVLAFPLLGAFFLYFLELLHMDEAVGIEPDTISWALAFAWCCYVTLDKNISVKKNDIVYALAAGVVFSGAVFYISDVTSFQSLLDGIFSGARFEGYGDDPNYYSLYACLALSCFVIKNKLKAIDYIFMFLLIFVGFLSASKMAMLLIIVNLLYLVFGTKGGIGKFARNIIIVISIIGLVFVFRDYIKLFAENLIERSGGKHITIDTLTTSRFKILKEYINILLTEPMTLVFGKGFSYHLYLDTTTMHGAHNTYLDFLLAWGITGTAVLIAIVGFWYKFYKKARSLNKVEKISKFPAFMLGLSFLSLSCFSANMFFFIIAVVILQLQPENIESLDGELSDDTEETN